MKHFILMAGLCLLAASCSKESVNEVVNGQTDVAVVPVKVHVDDFAVSLEDEPRGDTRAVQDVADYSDITGITLAFYKNDGSEAYKREQQQGDTGFGEFSLSLPMGSYTMVGGGTRFSQNVLPFSLVAREPAAFCGLNTIGLRRRGFDRDLINNIHMAYQIILQGTGKLNDLLARVGQEIPMSPEIDYILDFIRNSDRGFIR